MKHVFVFNPKSFAEKSRMEYIIDSIGQFFRTQQKSSFSIQISHFPRDAIGIIKKEVATAPEEETIRVYAVGGDGILFDCLNGIVGLPNIELAAIPYGKTNDFIRAFGEGKNSLFRNLESAVKAKTIPTDIISFGSNYAINSLTIGLESLITVKMNNFSRKYASFLNRFPFIYNPLFNTKALSSVFESDILRQQYDITVDNVDFSGAYACINIANGPCYGGNKSVAAKARPDDGILNVILFKSAGTLKTLLTFAPYTKGVLPSNCKQVQAKKIQIVSKEPLQIQADGELFYDTNITIEIMPKAVPFAAVNDLVYVSKTA